MAKKPAKRKGITERPAGSGIYWVRWQDWEDGIPRDRVKKIGTSWSQAVDFQERKRAEARNAQMFPELIKMKREEAEQKRRAAFTVNHAIEHYIKTARVSANTARHDRYHATLMQQTFGSTVASELARGDVEAWMRRRSQTHAENTVNTEFGFLKRCLRRAVRDGLLVADPTAHVAFYGSEKGRIRSLSRDEKEQLQTATWGPEHPNEGEPLIAPVDWLAIEFAYRTGLRQSEQFELTWDCVFIGSESSTLILPMTKAGKRQTVYLNRRAVEILEQLPRRNEFVFPSRRGHGAMNAKAFVDKVFRPALHAIGIEGFVWHDLRHTFGSDLARAGVPILDIQKLMRHAKIEHTLRYAHLAPSHLAQAIERVAVDF